MAILCLYAFLVPLFFSYTLFFTSTATQTISNPSNQSSSPPPHLLISPPPTSDQTRPNLTPFRPSIAVIVGVLTTMFSITFLLLLYAKHCKRGNHHISNGYIGNPSSAGPTSGTGRRNSGIDRAVIESLPIFRFASLRGHKEGLECAVCLTRFEPTEVLRLLPKCKHAFHVECVDTWLDAHSTCPLCRYRVDPEDVLLVEELKLGDELGEIGSVGGGLGTESEAMNSGELTGSELRRVSGRHSSAGEQASQTLQIVVQRPSESESGESCWGSRRSLDSCSSSKKKKRERESTVVTVGCFDLHRSSGRKDGLLMEQLEDDTCQDRESFIRRFDHRIILANGGGGSYRRWSDLRPSDLLFLQSEMIITRSGRYSLSGSSGVAAASTVNNNKNNNKQEEESGRSVINARCVSEITGLSRFANGAK